MGMKHAMLPTELINLPHPWGETDFLRRHKQIKRLSYKPNELKTALNVLERCLYSFSSLTSPQKLGDSIPDSLRESWAFTARWLADDMPTLDELNLLKVEEKLREYGIESPSPTLAFELATEWLWSVVWGITKAVLYWVEKALGKTRESIFISRFLYLVKRYWQQVEPQLASSLLSRAAMIGWQKALPLLESVEQNPAASEMVIETVRDYRNLILDHPHKWLPDSDVNEKWSRVESKTLSVTQPALRELAYV